MVGVHQHYVVCGAISFLLFLAPLIEAKERPQGGSELGVEHFSGVQERRRNEAQDEGAELYDSLHSDRLLMFGSIQMNTSARRHTDCVLDISVDIGTNTWNQQLSTSSFAFQLRPISSFGGMIGMISIYEHGGKMRKLWSHLYVVRDVGVQRFDATLSGDCTRITIPGSALASWIPSACPTIIVFIRSASVLRLPTDAMLMGNCCCPELSSHAGNICIIWGALEIYPTTKYEHSAYFGMAFFKTWRLYIWDQLTHSEESSRWHLVFGVRLLRTWHLHFLGTVFVFLHIVNWFLRILESVTTRLSKLERPVTVYECSHTVLDGELPTRCPASSGTSFSDHSRQSEQLSAEALQQDSWGDAQYQYLRNLMESDSPVDGSGFYYDCTAQRRSFSDLLLHSGKWSRDSNGRLIRDRP